MVRTSEYARERIIHLHTKGKTYSEIRAKLSFEGILVTRQTASRLLKKFKKQKVIMNKILPVAGHRN